MTKNNDKFIIIFGFLIILIYFIYYFNLYDIIMNITYIFHNKKEGFNQLFKPNRIFKYKNKIFLLDNREVLQNEKNPKVFNNFEDYKKYIMSLEESFRNNLNLYMNKKKVDLENIKSKSDIKELEIPKENINKYDIENKFPFFREYDCNRERSVCNQDKESPFFESIYDPKVLKNFQEEQCNKFQLDQKICNKFKNYRDITKQDELNEKCFNKNSKPDMNSKECKDNIFYQYNKNYVDDMCSFNDNEGKDASNINFEKKCLLEDYFRENMLEFEL